MLFSKKNPKETFDPEKEKPVIKASICNGEQVAGFKNVHTGEFRDIMLISNPSDLARFKEMYCIKGELEKIY